MMPTMTFGELVGGIMALAAMGVLAQLALTTGSEVAVGALAGVVGGGVMYFLRGRVQTPGTPNP